MMRHIDEIIVHCTATPEGRDYTVSQIDAQHRAQGWKSIGYHYVIGLDGTIAPGRDISLPGAHCRGHNTRSVGVCYVGGCDHNMRPKDTRTPRQKESLRRLITQLLRRWPGATVRGHRDFAAKACPCFDATNEYRNLI